MVELLRRHIGPYVGNAQQLVLVQEQIRHVITTQNIDDDEKLESWCGISTLLGWILDTVE